MDIVLGATYKDKVSGFTGVCTGLCTYLSGCNQALLIPKVCKDGSAKDGLWFDLQRLEQVGKSVVKLDNSKTPGFDKQAPIR